MNGFSTSCSRMTKIETEITNVLAAIYQTTHVELSRPIPPVPASKDLNIVYAWTQSATIGQYRSALGERLIQLRKEQSSVEYETLLADLKGQKLSLYKERLECGRVEQQRRVWLEGHCKVKSGGIEITSGSGGTFKGEDSQEQEYLVKRLGESIDRGRTLEQERDRYRKELNIVKASYEGLVYDLQEIEDTVQRAIDYGHDDTFGLYGNLEDIRDRILRMGLGGRM